MRRGSSCSSMKFNFQLRDTKTVVGKSMAKQWSISSFVMIWWITCLLSCLITAQTDDIPTATATATVPARWINNMEGGYYLIFPDLTSVQPILKGHTYSCGFYGNTTSRSFYFAVFIINSTCYSYGYNLSRCNPQVVWSANRNSPVGLYSSLEFKSDGDLVLKGADGILAWSTNTSSKSVVGMNLTGFGNLVLFDDKNRVIWESFDHPMDSLVPGQKLKVGQKLIPSVSSANLSESGMLLSFSMTKERGLSAWLETDPPLIYYQYQIRSNSFMYPAAADYVQFSRGNLTFFSSNDDEVGHLPRWTTPKATPNQYVKFGNDGHLRVYEGRDDGSWAKVDDLLTGDSDDCGYPTVCGEYGICSSMGQCICPASSNDTTYFKQIDDRQPQLGCSEITPLSCKDYRHQSFLELSGFTSIGDFSTLFQATPEACKDACASNCSCKAAFFYGSSLTDQDDQCALTTQLFTISHGTDDKKVYLKVQNPSVRKKKLTLKITLGSGIAFLILLVGGMVLLIWRRRVSYRELEEEYYMDQVPGTPNRFSYDQLRDLTGNFSNKLGEGGFGSVFEGSLLDSSKVAVKWLRGFGQMESSFLAEVETIGSIHHVKLVKLVGFCAEKSHRLLVYEYMGNGSLDRWIFCKNSTGYNMLTWERRKKVILDIAKGLNYLHEECRYKIIHMDIKPQNILLDDNFNAKVSDFGLAKLVGRDQSQFMTTMRGTPGYLAPEWLSARINEKVDVYSFGVVVLEIVCRRKVFDDSGNEEDWYLLSLLKRKAKEGRLSDMVDHRGNDLHRLEVESMIKLAAWCLQGDYKKRPSMSVVIKVLEGVMDVEEDQLDYNFWNPTAEANQNKNVVPSSAPPTASILSSPR